MTHWHAGGKFDQKVLQGVGRPARRRRLRLHALSSPKKEKIALRGGWCGFLARRRNISSIRPWRRVAPLKMVGESRQPRHRGERLSCPRRKPSPSGIYDFRHPGLACSSSLPSIPASTSCCPTSPCRREAREMLTSAASMNSSNISTATRKLRAGAIIVRSESNAPGVEAALLVTTATLRTAVLVTNNIPQSRTAAPISPASAAR